MDPITIAMGLANLAPVLLRYMGVGEKNVAVAEKAIDMAKGVTGALTGHDALIALNSDPEKAQTYRMAILANAHELELAYFADTANARERDKAFIQAGTTNVRANLMFVLAVAVIVGLAIAIWTTPELNEFVKGISTLILGRFLGYLDQIYNFEYGRNRSSTTKDITIENLSEKAKK